MSDKKVTLTVDGRTVTVPEGTLVIRAAEELGLYVPRFCDHPYLKPAGACRQCLVEVEGQRKPLTSCTTTCTEGMAVKTQFTSEIAKDGQEGVLELLLINHPLDCPMCDKGGECPLQDQTMAYGPGGSRYTDPKRRFVKPVAVNELVYLDRERCVLCARCTRFADEISGDPFIELLERGALEQVAIFEDDPYESNFSGNVIQICPVGALTSKEFRFSARPFDMTSTHSTCTQCAAGCAITVQERRGNVVRVLADEDAQVNDAWSCDKGRFAHAYVTNSARLQEPMVRKGGELIAVSWPEAVRAVADRIREARADGAPIGVLTGGNLLDEDAYALSRFSRALLGTNDVGLSAGVWNAEVSAVLVQALDGSGATNASIDDADAIVVVGLDLYEESPIVYLRVRKAADRGAKVMQVNVRRAQLPGGSLVAPPDRIVAGIERAAGSLSKLGGKCVILAGERLAQIPGALTAAWNASVRSGASFGWISRKGGTYGALAMGLHPDLLSGAAEQLWSGIPAAPGRSVPQILEQMATGAGLVFVVGADPVGDADDTRLAGRISAARGSIIALDMLPTPTTALADVVLPVAAPFERDGTMTNWEGRARPVRRILSPAGMAVPDWEVLWRIARELGVEFPASLARVRAEAAQMTRAAWERVEIAPPPPGAARPTPTDGAFTLHTYRLLIDEGTMMTGATELHAAAREPFAQINHADAARLGIADGARVRITGALGSGEALARVDAGVSESMVFVPSDQPGLRVARIADVADPFATVRVEAVR